VTSSGAQDSEPPKHASGNRVPDPASRRDSAATARLLLLLLAFAWGITWPLTRIALFEVSPWTLRVVGYGVGTLFMFALVRLRGRPMALPFGVAWGHVIVSALLTVVGFGLLTAFAQLSALTSRVVIIAYSMPIWASLLAWLFLGERLTVMATAGLVLCVTGLAVLVIPIAELGLPVGLVLALAAAVSWAAGTVYLKWVRLQADVVALTAWQLLVSYLLMAACVLFIEGVPRLWPLSAQAIFALAYQGFIGTGLAYFLWFSIVGRVSAATASLGSLCVPVVGILGSVLILGDRPTFADAIGFALIFAAAACVMIQPGTRTG
jgi:drug/metabolite transporter (DMT)-like permease